MRQILVLFVLVLLMQVVIRYGGEVGASAGASADSLTLLTTGFILVGAYTMGELFRRMRLPALLGYLAAGVLFGPKLIEMTLGDPGLAPLGAGAIKELGLVNVLAVGVIGVMGGGEIKLPELRENLGKLVAVSASVFLLVLPTVVGVVLGLTFIAPNLVPFLAELPLSGRIAGALLFGVLAVGMSPSATLALLQEVRAHGKFTSLVLSMVVFADLILVATFLLSLVLAKLLISPEGLSWASLAEALPHIAAEFGWALVLGLVVGLAFILYLRFVRREVLLFSLAVVFITAFVAARLHAETLLAFLVGGFVVQNFSRHGHTLIEAFERIALPVFVIYFTAQAAALDLQAVTVYLPLTLILVAVRCSLFVLGIGFGARKAGVDDVTRRHLQVSFFSQGGVDLVLAAIIAESIPGWGADIQTVTMATILFYIVGGPPFLARVLDEVGESAAARERGAEQLASTRERMRKLDVDEQPIELAEPEADDPQLARRLVELHALLLGMRQTVIDEQVLARARRRRTVLDDLAATIRNALEVIGAEPSPRDAERARALLDAAVAEAGSAIVHTELAPFDGRTLARLFATLDRAQEYGQSFRVVRSEALFEPRGGRVARSIRVLRRARRGIAGPGHRTVPVGRLWRYHVSLAVPVALWRTTRPTEAALWHALLEHYRLTRAQLDALVDGSWAQGPDVAESDHGHGHHDEPPTPEPPTLAQWLASARSEASERELSINERVAASQRELERGLLCGIAGAWQDFLDSVELAGTLERPAWRTRPSTRYDAAQAAIADLLERSGRDREAAGGRLDALLVLAHAEHVATSIRTAALEFESSVSAALGDLDEDFASLLARGIAGAEGGSGPDPRELSSVLTRMGEHVERLRRRLASLAQVEPVALRRALARTPEQLAPSSTLEPIDDDGRGEPDPRRTSIRLRAWLAQTLVQDFGAARTSADEELGTGLDALRQALAHVARVVDYHVGDPHADASVDANDSSLAERLTSLLERAHTQVEELSRLAREHIDETVAAAEQAGLEPLRQARWDELRRRLRRLDEGPRPAVLDWVRERGNAWLERADAVGRSVGDELSALFAGGHTAGAVAAWRRALFGPRSSMPEPYQRLFTSVPAETVGLLIVRPELTVLSEAADRWLRGLGGTILMYGDRGVGKRTLVRQLIAELGDRIDRHWLRLSPTLEREVDVVRELAPWFGVSGVESASTFAELQQQVQSLAPTALRRAARRIEDVDGIPGRQNGDADTRPQPLIVVENAERLFRRTPDGLVRVRRFLELIAATSDHVLWIVLMAEPAVAVLDPALELRARFPTVLQVPGMNAEQLAAVLDGRHRLSGYALRLDPGVPTLNDLLREPWSTRLWRSREDSTYERLVRLSNGNVRQALRLWLAAARAATDDQGVVVVGPLPGHATPLLEELPLASRVLLAALLLHGPLRRADLVDLHGAHALDLDDELARLAHLGLVMFENTSRPDGRVITVDTRLIQPLTAELRACNLL
ncbi:MAG TPA: cation:proton antiporter [Enhygromyxa sp.]|nr:cation:proton antiporter [Enhygromyxa sp.]